MRVDGYWAIFFFNDEYEEYKHILLSNLRGSNYYTNNL